MRIASLHLYPVKSTAAIDVDRAQIEPWGLAHDRRWLVVDAAGARVSAMTRPVLLTVRATPTAGGLRVCAPGHPTLDVAAPTDGPSVGVGVTRQPELTYAGQEAADWFTLVVGSPVRLVWQRDPRERPVSASHGGRPGDVLSLADTAPILLTTTSSLARLNAWIAEGPDPAALPMARFRPNVVVEGDLEPFAEDGWRAVRLGAAAFRFTETCDRCAVTGIDTATLHRGKEPIRTLAQHRKWDGVTWFGIRMLPTDLGVLEVGDPVDVLESA
ncbi:MOSC domain-containing protein [Mumia sp. zg.B53]|uniref:MOSC domain-containing protein n=1 Tax=Mumia sp. zg.B53 TaxID=2855449 RepID=UPI001C6E3A5C|nr:MOSC N-terminal beta barrel domain-containing protein [Mumia sp. zg.B53]MBW9214330.1 MOSC domain-containing protein [Mumia sp. zg.B53]